MRPGLFFPIYDALHKKFLGREVIHADEVQCQVLRDKDWEEQPKSYFWICLTGSDVLQGIVRFDYQPGRAGEYTVAFLEGFSG